MPRNNPNPLREVMFAPSASPTPLAVPNYLGLAERFNESAQPLNGSLFEALGRLTGSVAPFIKQIDEVNKIDNTNAGKGAGAEVAKNAKSPAEIAAALNKTLPDKNLSPEFRIAYRELLGAELGNRYHAASAAALEDARQKQNIPDPVTGLYPEPKTAEDIQTQVWKDLTKDLDPEVAKSVFLRSSLYETAAGSNLKTAAEYRDAINKQREQQATTLTISQTGRGLDDMMKTEGPKDPAMFVKAVEDAAGQSYKDGIKDPHLVAFSSVQGFIDRMSINDPEGAAHMLDSLRGAKVAGSRLDQHPEYGPRLAALQESLDRRASLADEHAGRAYREEQAKAAQLADAAVGKADLGSVAVDNPYKAVLAIGEMIKGVKTDAAYAGLSDSGRNAVVMRLRAIANDYRSDGVFAREERYRAASAAVDAAVKAGNPSAASAAVELAPAERRTELYDRIAKATDFRSKADTDQGSSVPRQQALNEINALEKAGNGKIDVSGDLAQYEQLHQNLGKALASGDPKQVEPARKAFEAFRDSTRARLVAHNALVQEAKVAADDYKKEWTPDIYKRYIDAGAMTPADAQEAEFKRESIRAAALNAIVTAKENAKALGIASIESALSRRGASQDVIEAATNRFAMDTETAFHTKYIAASGLPLMDLYKSQTAHAAEMNTTVREAALKVAQETKADTKATAQLTSLWKADEIPAAEVLKKTEGIKQNWVVPDKPDKALVDKYPQYDLPGLFTNHFDTDKAMASLSERRSGAPGYSVVSGRQALVHDLQERKIAPDGSIDKSVESFALMLQGQGIHYSELNAGVMSAYGPGVLDPEVEAKKVLDDFKGQHPTWTYTGLEQDSMGFWRAKSEDNKPAVAVARKVNTLLALKNTVSPDHKYVELPPDIGKAVANHLGLIPLFESPDELKAFEHGWQADDPTVVADGTKLMEVLGYGSKDPETQKYVMSSLLSSQRALLGIPLPPK